MSARKVSGVEYTGDPGGCHHLPGLLAVRLQERDSAIEALTEGRFKVREPYKSALGRVVRDFPEGLPVGLLNIGDDPHLAAEYLSGLDRPIQSAPIHGVGYEGHAGFMSGDGPGPVSTALTGPDVCESDSMIAVIDSGIVKRDLRPDWMGPSYIDAETTDLETVEKDGASHGTFVSSIIRKLAPGQRIAFAAARPDREGRLTSRHKGAVANPPTDELEVLAAVGRLIRRFGDRPSQIAALNLSLGATECRVRDGFVLTLHIAIEMWRQTFGYDAPIFAAGGNSTSLVPVYPAAFPWVRAVAAGADQSGKEVVWDEGSEVAPFPRAWVTDVAPGVKIHGLSGESKDGTVWWSGSSFATAVATAQSVTGQSFEVDGSQTYWRDRSLDYRKISNLEFG